MQSAASGIKENKDNCWEIIRWLIEKRVDVEARTNESGFTTEDILEQKDWSYVEKYHQILRENGKKVEIKEYKSYVIEIS